jgi:hypothetical protein
MAHAAGSGAGVEAMNDILGTALALLTTAGLDASRVQIGDKEAVVFEDSTVLGFIFAYKSPSDVTEGWQKISEKAVSEYQFALRRAGLKAWNTYTVLLAEDEGHQGDVAAFASIEENLAGTRKIARMAVRDADDIRAALLPLLPLQAAPQLEAVDIPQEIRQRATELTTRMVDAFLSTADDSIVLQVLEEGQ